MPLKLTPDEKNARFLRIVGGPILKEMTSGMHTVNRIASRLKKAKATISKNMKRLAEMGLICPVMDPVELKDLDLIERKRTVRGQKKPFKLTASGIQYLKVFARFKGDDLKKETLEFVRMNRSSPPENNQLLEEVVTRAEATIAAGPDCEVELRSIVDLGIELNRKGIPEWTKQEQILALIETFKTRDLEAPAKEQAIRLTKLAIRPARHNVRVSAMTNAVKPWLVHLASEDAGSLGSEALLALGEVRTFDGSVTEDVLLTVMRAIWQCLKTNYNSAACSCDAHLEALAALLPDLDDSQRQMVVRSGRMVRANSVDAFIEAIKTGDEPDGESREVDRDRERHYRAFLARVI